MDSGLKVHKVISVVLDGSPARLVDLHLTPHHTILIHSTSKDEIWISHSLLLSIHLHASATASSSIGGSSAGGSNNRTPLVIRARDFTTYTVLFGKKSDAKNVYESLEAVIAKRLSTEQLYAFSSVPSEPRGSEQWNVYDAKKEYVRMGVFDSPTAKARTSAWRFTTVNASYEYCPTYPSQLVVPSKISDATLNYGKAYRSKCRIPGLVYLHWNNLGTLTRASQPMVGLKNNRSIQDEKLIEAVFNSHSHHSSTANNANASYITHSTGVFGATSTNLIIDARPTTNAMANVAKGAGTENMDHYRNCKKVYLGIDNIHVMRDSLARVVEATRNPHTVNYDLLRRSGWLKHLSCILEGILIIVKAVHLANSHVLIHCSDGWDRTSQLSALSQICLDPYYRTLEGLAILIEKDWVSFGHRFADRLGHTVPARVQCVYTGDEEDEEVGFLASMQQRLNFSGSGHGFKETCPVFDQFLDAIHQLLRQYPERFQYNELFLLEIQKQIYECKYGNFLYNSERERTEANASAKTASIWHDLLHPRNQERYRNSRWVGQDSEVLFPDPKDVKWWSAWFKRDDMNAVEIQPMAGIPGEPVLIEGQSDDPVLRAVPRATAPVVQSNSGDSAVPRADGAASHASTEQNSAQQALDATAISQASTAVQGAMRSAWSAWRSVRSGYDGMVKEMNESPSQHTGSSSISTLAQDQAAGQSRPSSPARLQSKPKYATSSGAASPIRPSTPRTEYWSNRAKEAEEKQPERILELSASSHSVVNSTYEPRSAASEENPWKSSDRDGDPLGVKVWS